MSRGIDTRCPITGNPCEKLEWVQANYFFDNNATQDELDRMGYTFSQQLHDEQNGNQHAWDIRTTVIKDPTPCIETIGECGINFIDRLLKLDNTHGSIFGKLLKGRVGRE